ncbi:MAG: hypothetical protein K8F25_13255 [Fimbriimonadaceae bacterium]|nr:hypothetical protein [Alphaproteobacteria bacterium]
MQNDIEFFEANPDRKTRMRKPFPFEYENRDDADLASDPELRRIFVVSIRDGLLSMIGKATAPDSHTNDDDEIMSILRTMPDHQKATLAAFGVGLYLH